MNYFKLDGSRLVAGGHISVSTNTATDMFILLLCPF